MKVRLISPFDDAEQIWIGLDEPGIAARSSGSCRPRWAPRSSWPASPSSSRARRARTTSTLSRRRSTSCSTGSGLLVSEGEEAEFEPGHAMWVPKGVHHQHRNTGTEPLKLLWVYTPQAELPTT